MKIDVRIEKQEGRKYWLRSEISDPATGEVHAESNALFYRKFPEQGSWNSAIRKYGANSGTPLPLASFLCLHFFCQKQKKNLDRGKAGDINLRGRNHQGGYAPDDRVRA